MNLNWRRFRCGAVDFRSTVAAKRFVVPVAPSFSS